MTASDPPQSEDGCPDGAPCHHRCLTGCWRVAFGEPLSGVYPYDRWPSSTVRAYTYAAPPVPPEERDPTAGVPLVDLTAQLRNMDTTIRSLRASATMLSRHADDLQQLADTLRGD